MLRPNVGWAVLAAGLLSLPLLAGSLTPPARAQTAKPPDDRPENYPDGPHRESTFYFCTACHSFKLVSAQGMTKERWSETLDWMEQRHGLPKTAGKERDELVEYLSTAFPPRQQRGWKNPFSQQ